MISGSWLRTAPEESSTPLTTRSYWSAVMLSGSISPRSAFSSVSSPPDGMENGLWQNSSSPLSSPISYIGKSTIQQKAYCSLSMWPGTAAPIVLIRTPAVFCACVRRPAAMPTKSPGTSPSALVSSSCSGAANFAIPPTNEPFSSTRNQYGFAPACTSTSASVLSMNLRVPSKCETTTALMRTPVSSLPVTVPFSSVRSLLEANGPKPQSFRMSVTSCATRSMRRSGLSEPYFSIASR